MPTTLLVSDDPLKQDPMAVAVIDGKAVYDALKSEQTAGDDRKAQLEIAIIKESLQFLKGMVRWTPHELNPADGTTKMRGAHMEPMMKLIKEAKWTLCSEVEALARKASARQEYGYTPRPKVSAQRAMNDATTSAMSSMD